MRLNEAKRLAPELAGPVPSPAGVLGLGFHCGLPAPTCDGGHCNARRGGKRKKSGVSEGVELAGARCREKPNGSFRAIFAEPIADAADRLNVFAGRAQFAA